MYYENVFESLNRHKVRYLVAGGVAIVLHGVVRLTVDLDLFVELTGGNIKKFASCMTRLGYKPKIPVKIEDLGIRKKRESWIKQKDAKVFSLFHLDKHEDHIDVFIYEPIPFKAAYKNRKVVKARGMSIPIVSADDLAKMKKIAGRKQDIEDVRALRALGRIK